MPGASAHPGSTGTRVDDVRREGPRHVVPTDRAAAASRGRADVLVVLLDDVGFGASSAFGGPCSDTDRGVTRGGRSALQPVPHDGAVRAHPPGAPDRSQPPLGGDGQHHGDSHVRTRQQLAATEHQGTAGDDAEADGHPTAQFGKCHEVPVWQSSPMGPFDAWPSGGGGFETFYGFIGGETNQWEPALYDGTTPVDPPARRRRGTTSPRTWPTTPPTGSASRRP